MKLKKRGMLALLLTLTLSLITAGCGQSNAPTPAPSTSEGVAKEISVGLIPAEAKVSDQAMEKFRTYLAQQTGSTIKMGTYPDYNGVVEAMNAGKLDMAFLGPLTYVIANHKGGARAIAAKTAKGVPYYYSYILVHKDAPYNTLDDLLKDPKSVDFAFGDINSTSGSLVPGVELKKRGVFRSKDDSDFKSVVYTGAHDVTALSIQNKKVTAGAIDSAYYDKLVEQKKVDETQFKKIWQSDKLFQYPFAVSKSVNDATAQKLQDALVNMKDKEILDAFAADGFVKAEDKDYAAIRSVAEADGRLK
ncbi:phosphate/phosphite/phosphonate ABC transporter substrate-binding protein [Tumebacillus sp. ITR2]|uniref:Phosphate/phosphite/phosphonate ABC transporter substrate-binding protein n=1 Tax=Tumebacillus amylolyticus TaxID=2801339 RepID=A0ABS1JB06_9BACL|nr:phosphate/phosphite/phosphonate ABC transporter substrate-binding protein [Tumebacillus amylolyticus]MBL0387456.1 phosphate/phosphite/phosphonate ABC transporter substrate-binding protein [Tumebacillus amylolyticus]